MSKIVELKAILERKKASPKENTIEEIYKKLDILKKIRHNLLDSLTERQFDTLKITLGEVMDRYITRNSYDKLVHKIKTNFDSSEILVDSVGGLFMGCMGNILSLKGVGCHPNCQRSLNQEKRPFCNDHITTVKDDDIYFENEGKSENAIVFYDHKNVLPKKALHKFKEKGIKNFTPMVNSSSGYVMKQKKTLNNYESSGNNIILIILVVLLVMITVYAVTKK